MLPVCFIQSLSRSWHTDLNYGPYHLRDLEMGLTADVAGWQGVLTPPRHLIPPLVYPKVRVCPHSLMWISYGTYEIDDCSLCNMYAIWFKIQDLPVIDTRTLLWGNDNLWHDNNCKIFNTVQKFILNSERFFDCNILCTCIVKVLFGIQFNLKWEPCKFLELIFKPNRILYAIKYIGIKSTLSSP
jgi:hypothetical protein